MLPSAHTAPAHQLLIGAWLAAVLLGFAGLARYQSSPGPLAEQKNWPSKSQIQRPANSPAILIALHPQCPCSRASLYELERLQARLPSPLPVLCLLVTPASHQAAWASSDIEALARRLPNSQIIVDLNGLEARGFSALTSGETLLFDRDGRALFRGGITASRGHEGPSLGLDRLAVAASTLRPQPSTPVFGCPLSEMSQP